MSKPIENLYTIDYQEGSRGSFIGEMLVYLLTPNDKLPLYIDQAGAVGTLCRGRLKEYAVKEDIPHPNDFFTYKVTDDYPDDFFVVPGCPILYIDLDQVSKVYKNWKCIHIVYEPTDLIEVHLQNWFKNFARTALFPRNDNYYQEYYLSRRHLFRFTSNDLRDLNIDDLKKFFEIYSANPVGIEANNKVYHSDVWKEVYKTIPDHHKGKFYTLNFADITGNMDSTLALLCEITGGKVDDYIINQYQNYINGQKTWHQSMT